MGEELPHILIVDDEKHMCRSLEILISGAISCRVSTALSYYEAVRYLNKNISLIVADLTMPGKNGLDLLREVKKLRPEIDIIMMTAHSTVESAIQAIKEGALEYLIKPFASETLLELIERVLKRRRTSTSVTQSPSSTGGYRFGDIIGGNRLMVEVYDRIERASEIDSTVLIQGENGTGKELIARAIHFHGSRHHYPFVCINCTALPEALLEHELFGTDSQGKIELAQKGTLFLDQVGNMSLALQLRLLRFLQDQEVDANVANKKIKINVRIIASSHSDLGEASRKGEFRPDLFQRLNVFQINVPPLRERSDDIPALIDYFIKKKSHELELTPRPLTKAATDLLMHYSYPGNVRELANIIERSLIVAKHRSIRPEDLSIAMHQIVEEGSLDNLKNIALEQGWTKIEAMSKTLEKQLLSRALILYKGASNDELAKILGTTRRILELRLREFGLSKYV